VQRQINDAKLRRDREATNLGLRLREREGVGEERGAGRTGKTFQDKPEMLFHPLEFFDSLVRCMGWQGHGVTRLLHGHLPLYPFNSFFSSVKKRQSVPWAISFCGLDLSIPTSWRRRA
jgi:hypothetical protein